jgi:hypothetical protein
MRRVHPGDPITVHLNEQYPAVIARVVSWSTTKFFWARPARRPGDAVFFQEDEGITWCRGHRGKVVDAFRVTRALR